MAIGSSPVKVRYFGKVAGWRLEEKCRRTEKKKKENEKKNSRVRFQVVVFGLRFLCSTLGGAHTDMLSVKYKNKQRGNKKRNQRSTKRAAAHQTSVAACAKTPRPERPFLQATAHKKPAVARPCPISSALQPFLHSLQRASREALAAICALQPPFHPLQRPHTWMIELKAKMS
ncbi:hypothetical protein TIFTF001_033264 [Ficus carica]|uniref:Uncharacterized protein n=1 Tax=Ficus carica TaxID=3494 RepID=A0AA88E1M9_FICCA|nr:hypothetical protein TIFTF001_033264 [Ficus carica]